MREQIETKMIVNDTGEFAVCLDHENRFNCWVMYKHPDGKWVSLRPALTDEILLAEEKLELMQRLIAGGIE